MKTATLAFLTTGLVTVLAVPAQALTIDFESIGFDGPTNDGPRGINSPLVIGDFSFTATDPFGLPPILVYSRQSTNNPDFGGTSILPNRSNTGITISRTDGSSFTFNSVDLSYAYDDQNQFFSGGTATYSFSGGAPISLAFDNLAGFQTFALNLTNLSSLTITADNPFAIDNVVLDEAIGAVPEPATWMTMIAGFGMIGGSLRVRSRKMLGKTA